MAKKKNENAAMPDPIQVQIDLLTYISKNDMVSTVNLINVINKFYKTPGSLAIKDTLMPNQYSTVNECSIYAAQNLLCLSDKEEVIFYQKYYYSLSTNNKAVAVLALDTIVSLPAHSLTQQAYLDAVKLDLKFNNGNLVSKIKSKI